MTCPKCKGTKHVLNKNNQWERCSCLQKEALSRELLYGGITLPESELSLDNLQKRFPAKPLKEESMKGIISIDTKFKQRLKPSNVFCIQGEMCGARDVVIQTLLYSAIKADQKVKQMRMEDLIALHFTENNGLYDDFTSCDIYSLYFGAEVQHNVGEVFIGELLRYSKTTNTYLILNTYLTYEGVGTKYGPDILKLFARPGMDGASKNDRRIVFLNLEQ